MSLTFQNNQPFVINYDNDFCGTEQTVYCLRKLAEDRLTIAGKFVADTVASNSNPQFTDCTQINTDVIQVDEGGSGAGYTLGTGWSNPSPGILRHAPGSVSSATITLTSGSTACGYLVTVITDNVTAGNITVKLGTDASAVISTDATTTFYFTKTNTSTSFGINASSAFDGDVIGLFITKVFWETAGSWAINCSGYASSDAGNTEPLAIDITGFSSGDGFRVVLDIEITDGALNIEFGGDTIAIPSTGTFVFYGEYTSGAQLILQPNTTFEGRLNNVYLYRMPRNLSASVWDLGGNFITNISSSFMGKENQNFLIETTVVELELENGCYLIKISDQTPAELIANGDFSDGFASWINTSGQWVIDEGQACITTEDTQAFVLAQILTNLVVGIDYTVTFDATIGETGTINVSTNDNQENFTVSGSLSYTFTAANTTDTIVFTFSSSSEDGAGACIDNVSCLIITEWDYVSNCFNVADSHECSRQLQWYNDVDSFGFKYASNVVNPVFELRIVAEIEEENYKSTLESYDDGNLNNKITYAETREILTLRTEPLPKFLQRCINVARLHENFYINGVKTIAMPEDYDTTKTKNKLFSIGKFNYYQEALMANSAGDDVLETNEYLIDPQTGDCVLSPQ